MRWVYDAHRSCSVPRVCLWYLAAVSASRSTTTGQLPIDNHQPVNVFLPSRKNIVISLHSTEAGFSERFKDNDENVTLKCIYCHIFIRKYPFTHVIFNLLSDAFQTPISKILFNLSQCVFCYTFLKPPTFVWFNVIQGNVSSNWRNTLQKVL